MAFANSIPGVSGGTIAFLLGFFDKMVDSVNTLISPKSENKKGAFLFLLRLGISWIVGFILAVLIVTSVFESHIYAVSSLFIGFIVFSIPLVAYEERTVLKGKYYRALWILPGFAIVLGITLLSDFTLGSSSGILQALLALPAGVLAIGAMIMPGISGSSLMMIFGLYLPIMDALKGLMHFDLSGLPLICCFLLGAIIGALGFVKGIRYLLKKFRAQTVYAVFGMMIASIYSICIGPQTLDEPKPTMTLDSFSVLFFLAGGLFIGGLGLLKFLIEKKKSHKNNEKTAV